MASPSRSFSALLNSSSASGLSSDYPGQVEGWVLKCIKKAYRFNEKQKAYLDAKFAIGQATGKKLDGDIVVREMALGPDGVCLFKVSEFHSKSRPTSRVVQPRSANNFPMMPISGQASFARARETAMAITRQHPITFDQYDICAMAKGRSLDRLKLSMLKSTCQKLELEVPPKLIRRKRVLLEKAVKNCTCHEPVD